MTITHRLTLLLEHLSFETLLDKTPIELGMDSMDYVEFGMLVEQEFGVTITSEEMYELKNKSMEQWVEWIGSEVSKKEKWV